MWLPIVLCRRKFKARIKRIKRIKRKFSLPVRDKSLGKHRLESRFGSSSGARPRSEPDLVNSLEGNSLEVAARPERSRAVLFKKIKFRHHPRPHHLKHSVASISGASFIQQPAETCSHFLVLMSPPSARGQPLAAVFFGTLNVLSGEMKLLTRAYHPLEGLLLVSDSTHR